MSGSKSEAENIRDAALGAVRKLGTRDVTGSTETIAVEVDGLRIVYDSPSAPQPEPPDPVRLSLAREGRLPLPHTLEIWDTRGKCFSVSWNRSTLAVMTFRVGPWIDRLLLTQARADHLG
jgi:hypothetical protein